jgi:hypothetical protein
MSVTGHFRASRFEAKRHRQKVAAKYEKVRGLEALLLTCEIQPEPDLGYIRQLKVRLRTARMNLAAMTTDEIDL